MDNFFDMLSNIRTDLEAKDMSMYVSNQNFTIPSKEMPKNRPLFRMGRLNRNVKEYKVLPKEMKKIRYLLITNNGNIINIYKHDHDKTHIDGEKTKKEAEYAFLKPRFNKLPDNIRLFITFISNQIIKSNKAEMDIICRVLCAFCETPNSTRNFFELITKNHCHGCHKIVNDKVKCIHFDCNGMCRDCFSKLFESETCPACKKPQILNCPICLERWDVRSCRVLKCGHGICYKCITRSLIEQKQDILKCPQCRSQN